jgi:lysophospholipase L1-like esterase
MAAFWIAEGHAIAPVVERFSPPPPAADEVDVDDGAVATAGPGFVGQPAEAEVDEAPPLPARPNFGGGGAAPANIPKAKQPIEDPCLDGAACKRHVMDGFYAQLAATEAGHGKAPTRVSYYGDSVSATDQLPGRVRARLQDIFGDGGPGFVFAARPHRFNHNLAVDQTDKGWAAYGVSTISVADSLYGVGGSTAEAIGDGTIKIKAKTPSGKVARIDVYYLTQPHGGTADLLVDGQVQTTINTGGEAKVPGYSAIDVPDAAHKIELKVTGGRVRLFGLTLERPSGVVVDNMAIVSATAKNEGQNQAEHWKGELSHRAADLVIVMLGTNEAEWLFGGKQAMAEYQGVFEKLLAPIRAGRPDAACLVVSPLDQAELKDEKLASRPVMPHMVEAQRRAAAAQGCAFYDTYTWQGGKGSAIKWNRRGLVGTDFQHLSEKGSAMVADGLVDALLAGYAEYKAR